MGRWVSAATRRLGNEAGFTLPELLISASVLLFVVGGAMGVLIASMHTENTDRQFSQEIQDAQVGLARMMREIRQTNRVVLASANTIRFVLPGATDYVVQYECDVAQAGTAFRQCTRVRAALPPNGDPNSVTLPAATTGAPILQRLTNGAITSGTDPNAVFHYSSPDQAGTDATGQPVDANGAPVPPTYVQGQAIVPAAGVSAGTRLAQMAHTTALSSGAYLRNVDIGS
jgi:type II secretory pathway pseudopilin PulG